MNGSPRYNRKSISPVSKRPFNMKVNTIKTLEGIRFSTGFQKGLQKTKTKVGLNPGRKVLLKWCLITFKNIRRDIKSLFQTELDFWTIFHQVDHCAIVAKYNRPNTRYTELSSELTLSTYYINKFDTK